MTPKSKRKSIHSRMLRPVSRAFGKQFIIYSLFIFQNIDLFESQIVNDLLDNYFVLITFILEVLLNINVRYVYNKPSFDCPTYRDGVWPGQGPGRRPYPCGRRFNFISNSTHSVSGSSKIGAPTASRDGGAAVRGGKEAAALHQTATTTEQENAFQQNTCELRFSLLMHVSS